MSSDTPGEKSSDTQVSSHSQLTILIWHHFLYYKRHFIKLGVTIILPIVFLGLLWGLIDLAISNDIAPAVKYAECQSRTMVPLSAGPFMAVLDHVDTYHQYQPNECQPHSMQPDGNVLDRVLRGEYNKYMVNPYMRGPPGQPDLNGSLSKEQQENTCTACSNSKNRSFWLEQDRLCVVLQYNILFYPNNSEQVIGIMEKMAQRLKEYQMFFDNFPESQLFYKLNDKDLSTSTAELIENVGRLLAGAAQYKGCALDPKTRISGFKSKQDAINHINGLTLALNDTELRFVPGLWGIVGFDNAKDFVNYRIVYDTTTARFYTSHKLHIDWLQDLVEDAIVWQKLGHKSELSYSLKEMPNKCWERPQTIIHNFLYLFLPCVAVLSFVLSPANFLEQVVMEKHLKLREYMFIMGVKSFTLKMSWIIFYLLFLIPLSILFAVLLVNFPGPAYGNTDTSLIFITVILFNICQLSFCYMLASFIAKPGKAGVFIGFVNMFCWIYSAFAFIDLKIKGSFLLLARLSSLYCVTPMTLAFAYITDWERRWVGAHWWNLFSSTSLKDQYGGIGECFLWMIGDTIMYFIVAWYVEHVMPGDYGVRYPFYFPLQASYWFPKSSSQVDAANHQMDFEEIKQSKPDIELVNRGEPGIVITNLTKDYGQDKVAINKLNLEFYKQEITAFLGQNGAGKSTTLNCLVGLISPSSGDAKLMGKDIHNQMEEIRKILGFVPQYDILYPSMTVNEHLKFFGWLKGLNWEETQQRVLPLLTQFDLLKVKNNVITKLSGGQKRKLSILTAYIGNPQIIILDEPTSGVDPFSRRSIWDAILSQKKKATTVLSTHHMQEADILGDRVAIISIGQLQCSGTPMYLKNRYGKGFRLVVACDPQRQNAEGLKDFVNSKIPESKLIQETGLDLTFSIPLESAHSQKVVVFLKEFEANQPQLGFTSYGLSEPTMEEVFFSAVDTKFMALRKTEHVEQAEGINLGGIDETQNIEYDHSTDQSGPLTLYIGQTVGLLIKKMTFTILSWSAYLLQLGIPAAFLILLFLFGNQVEDILDGTITDVHIWENYRTNVFFIQDEEQTSNIFIKQVANKGLGPRCQGNIAGFPCTQSEVSVPSSFLTNPLSSTFTTNCTCADYCLNDENQIYTTDKYIRLPSGDILFRISSDINATSWIIHANTSKNIVVGGFQFQILPSVSWNKLLDHIISGSTEKFTKATVFRALLKNNTMTEQITLWYRAELKNGIVNMWRNMELQTALGSSTTGINMKLESTKLIETVSESRFQQFEESFQLLLSSFFLDMCFAFGTFSVAVFIQHETNTGLKRLQLLFGTNPITYWIVNLITDFILYLGTVGVAFLLLGLVENSFSEQLHLILAVVLPYGYMAITFTYLLTFMFKGTLGIVVATIVMFLIFLIAGSFLTYLEVFSMFCDNYKEHIGTEFGPCTGDGTFFQVLPTLVSLTNVVRAFPQYYLVDSMWIIVFHITFKKTFPEQVSFLNPVKDLTDMKVLGKRFITACVVGTAYLLIVLILEAFDLRISCKGCKRIHIAESPIRVMDEDVLREEQRVLQNPELDDPLLVQEVTKVYSGMNVPAVSKITFSLPTSQCFGLLGINGAGKSSLFRILTGSMRPTTGAAILKDRNLASYGWNKFKSASYCPQENTLFDSLTVTQHLKLFSRIRGVAPYAQRSIINSLIEEVGLDIHKYKRAAQLSGGNQRKLQFAIALLGYCPVIFLDEPTTGMDPGARKMAWTGIRRAIAKGCSVVLTSHSMEECEELCHRLVIMAAGSFQCIGSVQYLKDKFGNKYTFKLKVSDPVFNHQAEDNQVLQVKDYIQSKYRHAELIEQHSTQLHFEIPAKDIRLSELFETLCFCSQEYKVEEFSVCQTTLEHMFVNMARMQEMLQSGVPISMHNPGLEQIPSAHAELNHNDLVQQPKVLEQPVNGGASLMQNVNKPARSIKQITEVKIESSFSNWSLKNKTHTGSGCFSDLSTENKKSEVPGAVSQLTEYAVIENQGTSALDTVE